MASEKPILEPLLPEPRKSPRLWRALVTAIILNAAIYCFSHHINAVLATSNGTGHDPQALSAEAAGNRTLGFDSIHFINIKSRHDRLDAMSLQAYLSGLDITESAGVESSDIRDVGMPPTHLPGYVRPKEKGCFRAHANIWSMMLRKDLDAVLILESDATWDVKIRDIMSNFNRHFIPFLQQIDSSPLPDPRFEAGHTKDYETKRRPEIKHDPRDPWLSRHWDVLSLGHCFEMPRDKEVFRKFSDAHVPGGMNYWGLLLGHERVVRKSGGLACMTGYALSRTGAAKLLLRSALDLDDSVDMIMRRMILAGDLVAFSTFPTIMAQWQYVDDIGMVERGANSDIRGKGHELDENALLEGWDKVWDSRNVWRPKAGHPDVAFEEMALSGAWSRIFGNSSLQASTVKSREYY
ncbi:hypothetical protein HIM_02772 [Hirsutella minnesotensis 3608]|nr:hypothetical protein HIM_02772 [Hirsutella minnesotensis 3608]